MTRISNQAGEALADPDLIALLDGSQCEGNCADYLDGDLADLGITGGTVRLVFDRSSKDFRVVTDYHVPADLTDTEIERLSDDTRGQWSDGIGECGFADLEDEHELCIELDADYPSSTPQIEWIDDGRTISKPLIASAARNGRLEDLRKLIDGGNDVEMRSQGYTPLHLAILYGHRDCALELIRRGANVRALDPSGHDPLLTAAISNSMSDDDATMVARRLIENGVPVNGYSPAASEGHTPLFFAENRKKDKLAALLRVT